MIHTNLKLTRPLCFIDLETTGVNVETSRIVEISVIKINIDGSKESKTKLVNPCVPIPAEASEIHGIKEEDIKDAPTFKQIAHSFASFLSGCDIAGFNSNRFDIPMLIYEFERACVSVPFDSNTNFVDVFRLYCHFQPRTLAAAYLNYTGKELDSHKAENDALATYEILDQMMLEHSEIYEASINKISSIGKENAQYVDLLGKLIRDKEGDVCWNFGKNIGQKVKNDSNYANWILNNTNLAEHVKSFIRNEITAQ